MDHAIWTVDEVKSIVDTGAAADTVIELFINAVSREIEGFCHDKFASRSETLVLDGPDGQSLDLGSRIVSVSEVREGDNGKASTGTVRDPVVYPYVVKPEYGILFSSFKWKFGVQNVQVKAIVGWATRASLPDDLRLTALRAIVRAHNSNFEPSLPLPLQSESIGEYSYSLAAMGLDMKDIFGADQSTLLRYRRWPLA